VLSGTKRCFECMQLCFMLFLRVDRCDSISTKPQWCTETSTHDDRKLFFFEWLREEKKKKKKTLLSNIYLFRFLWLMAIEYAM
jgi:hypothetical protein